MGQVAYQTMTQHQHAAGTPFLAADVGGTHARLGLVSGLRNSRQVNVLAYHKYECRQHENLAAIVRQFLQQYAPTGASHAALACAGYVIDQVVINDNLPWKVDIGALKQSLELDNLVLINDFEAVAYATRYLDPTSATTLTDASVLAGDGAQVVVGPGTGLGSAVLLPGKAEPTVLATEAGQIALAPGNALEMEILRVLASTGEHVSVEHALSGPGLLNIYNALCTLEQTEPTRETPEDVTTAAMSGDDPQAHKALEVFCGMLGSFAGDLAMLYGASGGVWLAGGILPKIRKFLVNSSFIERFLEKGRMRAFLERVPVRLMEHGQLGVIGAAGWYLDHETGPVSEASSKLANPDAMSGPRQ